MILETHFTPCHLVYLVASQTTVSFCRLTGSSTAKLLNVEYAASVLPHRYRFRFIQIFY